MSLINDVFIRNSFLGMDGYRWFIAQVPPGETPDSETWGERVRCRIFGNDTPDGSILPNDDLFYAKIAKSCESGFDNRQSSGIVGGETVIGFFMDGDEAQEPIITGIIDRYVNYSGTTIQESLASGSTGFRSVPPVEYSRWRVGVAEFSPNVTFWNTEQGDSAEPEEQDEKNVLAGDDTAQPGLSGPAAAEQQKLDSVKPGPDNCGNVVSRIQVELNRVTEILKGFKKYYQLYVVGTANAIGNVTDQLQIIINNISAVMRTLVQRLRNFILRKLRNLLRDALDAILGDVLKDIKDSIIAKIFDALFCAFQDVISKLPLLIADFLAAMIGRFFAAPVCAAEQFINSVLNNLIQDIDNAIQPIISEINDILSGILEIGGQIMDAIDQVLGILGFLCVNKECFDVKEFSASPWSGPSQSQVDKYQDFLKKIDLKDISDDAEEWLNANDFGLVDDFSAPGQGVLNQSSCSLLPERCGPPNIDIFGGKSTVNALASAVVNQAGQVIGAIIEDPGKGYIRSPFVTFRDPCNNGYAAAGYGIINPRFGTLVRIVITNPGYGYLDAPNGRTTFDPIVPIEDKIEKDPRDIVKIPTGEKIIVDLGPGDTVSPGGPTDEDDDGQNVVPGKPSENDDPKNPTNYVDVIGCLEEVNIISTGIGYLQDDEILIIPEVPGLELKPRYTEVGQLVKIDISGQTCGFTDIPEIRINSATGAGVELRASLSFTKVSDYTTEERKRFRDSSLQIVQCISS